MAESASSPSMRFSVGGLEMVAVAELWVRRGFAVFPLAPGTKVPLISKRRGGQGVKDASRDLGQIRSPAWWGGNPGANVGVALGGHIDIDLDWRNNAKAGLELLESLHGPLLNQTLQSLTGLYRIGEEEIRGVHLWYRLPDGVAVLKSGGSLAEGVDFKTGPGAYVVGAGSWHGSGVQYEWDPEGAADPLEAPGWLIEQVTRAPAGKGLAAPNATGAGRSGGASRGTGLAGLIQMGLAGEVAGRNQWVTGVMGHISKMVPYDDGVRALGELVWRLAAEQPEGGAGTYERSEYEKTVDSILSTERGTWPTGRPGEGNGYLVSNGAGVIQALCTDKEDSEGVAELRGVTNFDIRALGLSVDDEGHQTWYVEVLVGMRREVGLLEGGVLGSRQEAGKWLSRYGAVWTGAAGDKWARVDWNKRLLLYLAGQGAEAHRTVEALGWSKEGGGFVCHEGVIGKEGLEPHRAATPAPILRNWAPFRYGFSGSQSEAAAVLREVMTFHDETAACVYGAWWAACLLKPQMFKEARMFPIMAMEAPSETGKTNGLFALLLELSGNTQGGGEMTMADLRDRMSSHHSGILHLDDITDWDPYLELLRQSAVEGSRSKKGMDRHTSEHRRMVAPVAMSAEGLGALKQEKAMLDRCVLLKVGSPVSRRSLRPGREGTAQYDDIIELRERYEGGGLTQVAGWIVAGALAAWEGISLKGLRIDEGRHSWKIAILRGGARVLAAMMGPAEGAWEMDGGRVVEVVDEWCGALRRNDTFDRLVLDIAPSALAAQARIYGMPRRPNGTPPIYVDDDLGVWVYPLGLADWWGREHRYDQRAQQLGSESAIRDQLDRLGAQGARKTTHKPRKGDQRKLEQHTYYRLPDDAGAMVLERCGWNETSEGQGVLGDA